MKDRSAEEVFNAYKTVLVDIFTGIGYREDQILVVPISLEYPAVNLIEHSELLDFSEMSLIEALDTLEEPRRNVNASGVVLFNRAYKIGGVGTVVTGMVIRGTVNVGDKYVFFPGMVIKKVTSIEYFHQSVQTARAGNSI